MMPLLVLTCSRAWDCWSRRTFLFLVVTGSMFFVSQVVELLHPEISPWMRYTQMSSSEDIGTTHCWRACFMSLSCIVYCKIWYIHFVRPSSFSPRAVDKPWWHACRPISSLARVPTFFSRWGCSFPTGRRSSLILTGSLSHAFGDGTQEIKLIAHITSSPLIFELQRNRKKEHGRLPLTV